MPLWDHVRTRSQAVTEQLQTKKAQFRNKDYADAAMAMCAIVAAADGSVDPAERRRAGDLIVGNDLLAAFPPEDLRRKFDGYCNRLVRDRELAALDAMTAIGRLRDRPDQARAVISIGIMIARADGVVDDAERAVVAQACRTAGLPTHEFAL